MEPHDTLNGADLLRDGERLVISRDGEWLVIGSDGRRRRRIVPDGGLVRASLLMMDNKISEGGKTMKISVGDTEIDVDEKGAAAIRTLQGQVAALSHVLQTRDATSGKALADTAAKSAAEARDALITDEARRRDPSTPYGASMARQARAWMGDQGKAG